MSDDSLFIENLGESLTAAAWVTEYPTRADANPEVVALIPANLPTHAQAALSATERRRSLLGANDAARRSRQGLDLDLDREYKRLRAEVVYRDGDDSKLRPLWGGGALGASLLLPSDEQVLWGDAFFARAEGATDVSLPKERLAAVKEKNELLRAAVLIENEADAAHEHAVGEAKAALKTFRRGYGVFVRAVIFELGEDVARLVLPHFDRPKAKAEKVEEVEE